MYIFPLNICLSVVGVLQFYVKFLGLEQLPISISIRKDALIIVKFSGLKDNKLAWVIWTSRL